MKYISNFDLKKYIKSVSLMMHDSDIKEYQDAKSVKSNENTILINDYLSFLNGQYVEIYNHKDDRNKVILRQLHGVSSSHTGNNRTRDNGLHFPVMYGNKPWWYEYHIVIDSEVKVDLESGYDDSIWNSLEVIDYDLNQNILGNDKISKYGDFWIRRAKGREYDDNSFTGISDDYQYSIANLIITFISSGQKVKIPLYHTGFFHYGEQNNIVNPPSNPSYYYFYYYEVVQVEVNGKTQYWLDRNLRADSNGIYIENHTGESLFENNNYPFSDASKGELFRTSFDYSFKDVCPPGYHIPTEQEFQTLIGSDNFHNDLDYFQGIGFYNSYFVSSNKEIGKVYFPKSRYYSGSKKQGESQTGYYWTSTPDPTNSENLKVFKINESASFTTGNIYDDYMSIRCIANQD